MTIKTILTPIIIPLFFSTCDNSPRLSETISTSRQVDTLKSIKINGYWATPKKTLDLDSQLSISGDSIVVITCTEFAFSPFGQIKNKNEIKTSLLKNFHLINRSDTMDNGIFEFQILKHDSSRLILFIDNNPEGAKDSYIFKGDIKNSDVNFMNGIKVGMTKESFINTFFDNFPNELLIKNKFIVFESCVTGLKQTYYFPSDKLQSVTFSNYSYWTVNY